MEITNKLTEDVTIENVFEIITGILNETNGTRLSAKLLIKLNGSENRKKLYHTRYLPKKRGGLREINIPMKELKVIQFYILQLLYKIADPHKTAKGFVPNTNLKANSDLHKNKKWILTVDIKDFFPSITWRRIYGMFLKYPFVFNKQISRIISNLLTYNNKLPQGSPASPYISNMICRKMDSRLYNWAVKNNCTYTRYADDLTFSSNDPKALSKHNINFIQEIISGEGFKLNEEKTRLTPYFKRQLVTGIVVNQKSNVKREYIRSIRAILFNVRNSSWEYQLKRNFPKGLLSAWKYDVNKYPLLGGFVSHYSEETYNQLFDHIKSKSRNEFVEFNTLQSFRKLLVRPECNFFKRNDIQSFQNVIRGRIDFIGEIRGKGDKIYLKLKNDFEWLVAFGNLSLVYINRIKSDLIRIDPNIYSNIRKYSELTKTIAQSDGNLRNYLQSIDNTLEIKWLLASSKNEHILKNESLQIIYSTSINPKITGTLFRYFQDSDAFDGLIHGPQINSDSNQILANSYGIIESYKKLNLLTNSLQNIFTPFLSAYKANIQSNKNPWDDKEFRKRYIIPFRKRLRFEDGDEAFDLVDYLQGIINKVIEHFPDREFSIPSACPRFYSDTKLVIIALDKIIWSMITNNTEAEKLWIDLSIENDEDFNKCTIEISDSDGIITKEPKLEFLFGNKLKEALKALRGLADWSLAAQFNDGCSYQFDVMNNVRTKLIGTKLGVTHKLNFYY